MSGDVGAEVAAVIRKSRMTPYEDGKGGWLFRSATDEELADALAPLIAAREEAAKAEGIAEGVDSTWHLKTLLAKAWDEGNLAGGYWGTSLTRGPYDPDPPSDNPYRAALDPEATP